MLQYPRMEVPPLDAKPGVPPDRIDFYQHQASELLVRHGREFTRFVKGHENLVALGDSLLRGRQASGYNILLSERDMPIASPEPLMFYSNYVGRPRHFGLLLAEMEHEGIITPEQLHFGVKASKVLHGD